MYRGMILAELCRLYGRIMKWGIAYPLWELQRSILRLEQGIYLHAWNVRKRWDKYMFDQQARDLRDGL